MAKTPELYGLLDMMTPILTADQMLKGAIGILYKFTDEDRTTGVQMNTDGINSSKTLKHEDHLSHTLAQCLFYH